MTVTPHGINIHTVGLILMIVGAVGLFISLLWMTVYADRRRRVVAAEDPAVGRRVYR